MVVRVQLFLDFFTSLFRAALSFLFFLFSVLCFGSLFALLRASSMLVFAVSALTFLKALYTSPEMSRRVLLVSFITFYKWFSKTYIRRSSPCMQAWTHFIFRSSSLLQTTTGLVVILSLVGVLPLVLAYSIDFKWPSNFVNSQEFPLEVVGLFLYDILWPAHCYNY